MIHSPFGCLLAGDTKWRGINKILLTDGYIFASTAKMNEYYFTGTSDTDAQRQYTMCHEIGHGTFVVGRRLGLSARSAQLFTSAMDCLSPHILTSPPQ